MNLLKILMSLLLVSRFVCSYALMNRHGEVFLIQQIMKWKNHFSPILYEVATESWPEWDLNPRPMNFVQTPRTQSQLCTATPTSYFVQCHISF